MLFYLDKREQKKFLEEVCNSLNRGVLILSAVVSGKSRNGHYFTFEIIMNLLNEYFRIVYVCTLIPKSIILSGLLRLFSIINTNDINWYKLFSLMVKPNRAIMLLLY
jgi:hypothetical protein